MSAKYHVSSDGVVRQCKAFLRMCRYGQADHYSSLEEAEDAYSNNHLPAIRKVRDELESKFQTLFTARTELVTEEELKLFPTKDRTRKALASLDDEQAYLDWESRLSFAENKAIQIFRNQSQQLNSALRFGGDDPSGYLEDDMDHEGTFKLADVLSTFDQLIERESSGTKELLYHGLRSKRLSKSEVLDWSSAMVPGSFLQFNSYISTSLGASTAKSFTSPVGLQFELLGEGALFIDSFEEEKVFPHHTVWKVIAKKQVTYNGAPIDVIQLLRKA